MRRKKKKRDRLTRFQAGAIGVILIAIFSYAAYTKFANPFASKFTVHALFSNASGLRPQSFVRIAGVNVGTVSDVAPVKGCKLTAATEQKCQMADVTMEIQDAGLPLHSDATFAIRPRIFLEGNFFVDVKPGTPSAPAVSDGHTFPVSQGTEPVQVDQVLSSLQGDTRHNLQLLLRQYGIAVKKGGAAYNASIPQWLPAYKYSSIVAHDALGIQPHDLSNWIAEQGPRRRRRRCPSAEPREPDHRLQHDGAVVRPAERRAPALDRRAAAHVVDRDPHVQRAQRGVPTASPARPHADAGRRRPPDPRSMPACRSSSSCGCSSARRSSAD